jgi:hypothetical protein
MPRQKVTRNIKLTNEWKYHCVDGVIASTKSRDSNRRRSVTERKRNYDLFNNKIDSTHFEYVTNPFNLNKEGSNKFQLPATLQPYDILFPIFNVLLGEEAKRFFNPIVVVTNESAINEKEEMRKQAVMQQLMQFLQIDPNDPEAPKPEEFLKHMHSSVKDEREIMAQHLLSYYKRKEKLPDIFSKGFKDWLLAGEEIYTVDSYNGDLSVRRVNPLQIWFVVHENTEEIDNADRILEINYMTVHEVIDEFYEYLTPEQIDDLEAYYPMGLPGNQVINPLTIKEVETIYHFQNQENFIDRIPVYRVRWKSFRKVGNWYYIDPQTGEEVCELVDEIFEWDKKDKNQRVEWFWINEYWEGIRIGEDMYIDDLIRPRKHQYRSMDSLSECKSGYIGNMCSATNSQSTSLMDRLLPWVYLYFIIWYDTELALATNMGKIALLDVSLIPDGWEMEKWMYYARAMRIGFVNSLNEGNRKLGLSGQNNSQQNRELDLEMGNYIQFNITLLQEIERKIQNTAGVPPQRLGAISSQELVGNVEKSLVQSSLVTEDLFRIHNGIKLRVCDAVIEVAKDLYKEGNKALQYVGDDMMTIMFQLEPEKFNSADYGTFVSDAIKDQETYAAFKEHAKFALQNDQMAFYQLADIYSSDSISEIKMSLKKYHDEQQKNQQAQVQAEQELEARKLAMEEQHFQQTQELDKYIADTNNHAKITVAEIGVFSRQDNLDLNGNGVVDPVEIADQALRREESLSKAFIEKVKMEHERVKSSKEQALKEREISSKEKIEKEKLQVERENMKNDLQVAKINASNRSKNKK